MRMPDASTIMVCGAGMIFLLNTASLVSQTEAKASFSLLHSRIDASEPVILNLEIRNLTDEALELNLGWNQHDQIYFTATGPSGRVEIHEPPPNSFDPVGRFGEAVISPKGTYAQQIVLSQWATFDTPGDYSLEIHVRGSLGLQSPDSLQVQTEATNLTIEPNAASLVQRHCAEEWSHLISAHNGKEAMDAALFVANVKSPIAVPFMSAALDTEHAAAIGGILITGLERIGTLDSVHALAGAMHGRSIQNAQFAHDALSRIALTTTVPEVANEARLALEARANTPKL
jgi:hypothetical protein